MKWFLSLFCSLACLCAPAQKYALLDMRLSQPVRYTDHISLQEQWGQYFPVEKEKLPQFVSALGQIVRVLQSPKGPQEPIDFQIGCVKFSGMVIEAKGRNRMDVVLNSNCQGVHISMHLCEARFSNARNAFFVRTWIKYIEKSGSF